jgi:glycosyltransferase involved in cell wall biosynthesis
MKIALACPKPPWFKGGVERVVGEIAKHLLKRDHVEIFCTDSNPPKYNFKIWEKIPVHVFKAYISNIYYFSPLFFIRLAEEIERFDLINFHNYSSFTSFASFVNSYRRLPSIFSPHFHPKGPSVFRSLLRKPYDSLIGKNIFTNVNKIVYDSVIEKKLVENKFGIKKESVIIYNGIDLDKIRYSKPYNIEQNLILYVGRLEKYKNVQYAIKVMKYLPSDFVFYIIGIGSYASQLRLLIRKLNLEKKVKMLGEVSDEEVYRWMKTASVFVHFSEMETFGMTCLEALAAGTPVVANDDKMGLTETASIFKDGIFLVDIHKLTPSETAKVILRISQKGKQHYDLKRFDWSNIAQEFRETYEETI